MYIYIFIYLFIYLYIYSYLFIYLHQPFLVVAGMAGMVYAIGFSLMI
jgi:hypothetical protein